MHILIIQPPDFEHDFADISIHREHVCPFSPPWDVLCLEQYFITRSRHVIEFLDMRLFSAKEDELQRALTSRDELGLAVVYCPIDSVGFATGVIELIKRHHPDLPKVIVGPFPTAFPEQVLAIPDIDFAIVGDPEKPLQLLADNLDVPTRWKHIPGLVYADRPQVSPHFHRDLSQRVLPSFQQTIWSAYKPRPTHRGARISAQLSSGHTGLPCDQLHEPYHQSLRIHDLNKMATCIQAATHAEVDTIHFTDPPGIWSPQLLQDFTNALIRVRNAQPWSFSMLPAFLSDDLLHQLENSRCREIIFWIPSPQAHVLETYGCRVEPQSFLQALELAKENGIHTSLHFLLGGPGSSPQDSQKILQWLKLLDYPSYATTPFPLAIASPLYRQVFAHDPTQHLQQRLAWARAPWIEKRPLPVWDGRDSVEQLKDMVRTLRSKSQGSLLGQFARGIKSIGDIHPIESIENWSTRLLHRKPPSVR